ncbi:hypothetical protein ColLi_09220 [Colletotrichum liriopes]|uniref:Cytochrome P450 n=1 Tax=Colletotrichum liriopes TaxID=708192 RepID=A0AA37LVV0_9PEZI|nr:hypothetical protein ColLi_09220 [Colletotrichum liriopes]
MTPPRGSNLPWSGGPRMCPDQKMSQVEFVTVIATLFRQCTAESVQGEHATDEAAAAGPDAGQPAPSDAADEAPS